MFTEIPQQRPATPLLDSVASPETLRKLVPQQLLQLADELRAYLLFSVAQSGGHFSAGLGVVELTIALHYALNTPHDRLIWDVGHQTYPHKILTGRREQLASIRSQGGLSGFPRREESEFDSFGVGHSSTSISAALGMALAAKQQGEARQVVAVIGDGAITAGMAFEALNHAVHTQADLLVVLNDNTMSISKNVGGLASYFAKILEAGSDLAPRTQNPQRAPETARQEPGASAAALFAELGFFYVGPIDGHNIPALTQAIGALKQRQGPRLLHVVTVKGKGFAPAEHDPVGYHALPPKQVDSSAKAHPVRYQDTFGRWLCDTARRDNRLIGITPAMAIGSGMVEFAREFPERFYDVAIAEQHAVTLAAGLACEGLKPVVAIYSTFLQRGYDQLVHDVALQNLDVLFAVDRAGLVGEDGPSHVGAFDISFLRCIPNLVIATPSDQRQCYQLLASAYQHPGPAAVRYPRSSNPKYQLDDVWLPETGEEPPAVGIGQQVLNGNSVCILNFGTLLENIAPIAIKRGYSLCDMRWAKPLDAQLIVSMASRHQALITLEESTIAGGAGSAVLEFLSQQGIQVPVLMLGLQDQFPEQGSRLEQIAEQQLETASLARRIDAWMMTLGT